MSRALRPLACVIAALAAVAAVAAVVFNLLAVERSVTAVGAVPFLAAILALGNSMLIFRGNPGTPSTTRNGPILPAGVHQLGGEPGW
jgi:hypothetical protein